MQNTNIELTEAEKQFHRSRIMWAVVNGELYWTYSELGHKEWLKDNFNINDKQFESILRGYIRKDKDNIVNIVSYCGSDFSTDVPTNSDTLRKLEWIANLEFNFDKIEWYAGVEIGEPGKVWKPKDNYKTSYKNESKSTRKIVPLIDLLNYEKLIITILNRNYIDLVIKNTLEKELKTLSYYLNNNNCRLTTYDDVLYRAYSYSEIW